MIGTAFGDFASLTFDHSHVTAKDANFSDVTVLTFATAKTFIDESFDFKGNHILYSRRYPNRGYGTVFIVWTLTHQTPPASEYDSESPSHKRSSAMWVAPIGWAYDSFEDTVNCAYLTSLHLHRFPEGANDAVALAAGVHLARKGLNKEEIQKRLQNIEGYPFPTQGSVPKAFEIFNESVSFEDAVRKSVSVGSGYYAVSGMVGALAEAYYGVPERIGTETLRRLPDEFRQILSGFFEKYPEYYQHLAGGDATVLGMMAKRKEFAELLAEAERILKADQSDLDGLFFKAAALRVLDAEASFDAFGDYVEGLKKFRPCDDDAAWMETVGRLAQYGLDLVVPKSLFNTGA